MSRTVRVPQCPFVSVEQIYLGSYENVIQPTGGLDFYIPFFTYCFVSE